MTECVLSGKLSRLDLAQADAAGATLRCEPTDLGELVEQAAIRFRKLHPSRVMTIERAPAPRLSVDRVLVRRVIESLLDNARKYSEPDSPIAVTLTASTTMARVAVTDHGIGIDEADLARMFTPFFRSDRSRTRTTGGVGLGQMLAKRVVEGHSWAATASRGKGDSEQVTLECINPPNLPTPDTYTQVVVATGTKLIFVAGQEPEDLHGKLVGRGDFAAQARQVFDNLGRALAAAGALPKHVARITIYVVDYRRDDHLPIIEAARVTLFGDHKPADVVVGIATLSPGYLIEVDAVAVLDA